MSYSGVLTGGKLPRELENFILYLLKLDYDKEKEVYLGKCKNKIISSKIKERNQEYLHPPDLFGRILVNPYPIIDLVDSYSEKEIIKQAYNYHFKDLSNMEAKYINYNSNNEIEIKIDEIFYILNPKLFKRDLSWKDYNYFEKNSRVLNYTDFGEFMRFK